MPEMQTLDLLKTSPKNYPPLPTSIDELVKTVSAAKIMNTSRRLLIIFSIKILSVHAFLKVTYDTNFYLHYSIWQDYSPHHLLWLFNTNLREPNYVRELVERRWDLYFSVSFMFYLLTMSQKYKTSTQNILELW